MACLLLSSVRPPPATKSIIPFSPRTCYPLPMQTKTVVVQNPSSSIYTTKLGISLIVRSASYDDGKNTPQAAAKQQRKVVEFWKRISKCLYVGPGSPLAKVLLPLMHFLCLFAPFRFSWDAVGLAFGLYIVTGLGITLSYHRNLSHRSFKLPKWLEYLFAYCGVHAIQGDPIGWVSNHRYHHQYADSKNDPHSPIEGFWYSHIGWLFDSKSANERSKRPTNVRDLENQLFYKFIHNTYIIHPIILATLLYVIGGFPYIVWGMNCAMIEKVSSKFLDGGEELSRMEAKQAKKHAEHIYIAKLQEHL